MIEFNQIERRHKNTGTAFVNRIFCKREISSLKRLIKSSVLLPTEKLALGLSGQLMNTEDVSYRKSKTLLFDWNCSRDVSAGARRTGFETNH